MDLCSTYWLVGTYLYRHFSGPWKSNNSFFRNHPCQEIESNFSGPNLISMFKLSSMLRNRFESLLKWWMTNLCRWRYIWWMIWKVTIHIAFSFISKLQNKFHEPSICFGIRFCENLTLVMKFESWWNLLVWNTSSFGSSS